MLGDDAPGSPWDLAQEWLPSNDSPERPTVTLATVDAEGWPNARTVLLSAWDRSGLRIHTDARSIKAAELTAVPRAAIVLRWPELARQLVVQGTVERDDAAGEAAAFARRDPYLKVLAAVNDNAYAQLAAAEREALWAQAAPAAVQAEQPPPTWAGFVVIPVRWVFWAGSTTMASRRVEYTADGDRWTLRHLPG